MRVARACGGRRRSTRGRRGAPRRATAALAFCPAPPCRAPRALGDVEAASATDARRAAPSRSRARASSANRNGASGHGTRLGDDTRRVDEGAARCRASTRRRSRPSGDEVRRSLSRSGTPRASPLTAVRTWTRSRRPSGIEGRAARRAVGTTASQLSRSRSARRAARTTDARRGLDHDDVGLRTRGEPLQVDAGRDDRVAAGKPLGRPLRDVLAGRDQVVDPREQSVHQVPSRWVAEAFGVDEGRCSRWSRPRGGRRRRGPEGGSEAVDDVEATAAQRGRDVRTDADRDPDRRPRRHGHRAIPRRRAIRLPGAPAGGRSRERDDGASTTTSWLRAAKRSQRRRRARSCRAAPSTRVGSPGRCEAARVSIVGGGAWPSGATVGS